MLDAENDLYVCTSTYPFCASYITQYWSLLYSKIHMHRLSHISYLHRTYSIHTNFLVSMLVALNNIYPSPRLLHMSCHQHNFVRIQINRLRETSSLCGSAFNPEHMLNSSKVALLENHHKRLFSSSLILWEWESRELKRALHIAPLLLSSLHSIALSGERSITSFWYGCKPGRKTVE